MFDSPRTTLSSQPTSPIPHKRLKHKNNQASADPSQTDPCQECRLTKSQQQRWHHTQSCLSVNGKVPQQGAIVPRDYPYSSEPCLSLPSLLPASGWRKRHHPDLVCLSVPSLLLHQVGIGATRLGHQFVVRALLDDLATLDHCDAVGAGDGAEPMRDHHLQRTQIDFSCSGPTSSKHKASCPKSPATKRHTQRTVAQNSGETPLRTARLSPWYGPS
jgi:hypothetical protein